MHFQLIHSQLAWIAQRKDHSFVITGKVNLHGKYIVWFDLGNRGMILILT